MATTSPLKLLALAFIAGFLSTIIFHQAVVLVLNMTGLMPPGFKPWSLDPVPPGVPTVIS